MRILIACDHLVASGGLLRFERVGEALRPTGHEVAFLAFRQQTPEFESTLPVLDYELAASKPWDAVVIPGAGFPPETIARFSALRAPQFGTRVQMILNDQHVRSGFLRVNAALVPHVVVFNNMHWPPGSYREFEASRFHHLIGAVDTNLFRPTEREQPPRDRFVIGAQIAKNPRPLIDALELLPSDFIVRFFGFDRAGAISAIPEALAHRVENAGPLFDTALSEYYRDLDVMVSTEDKAGWANVVAEAMASGVPVITTPAGTLSIASNEDSALVIEQPTSAALAECILRLRHDPRLVQRLTSNARAGIEHYDWQTYSTALVELVRGFDGAAHYTHAPELGLFGKATIDERLDGLEHLLELAPSFRTVLDIGAAEGVVAQQFLKRGAAQVDAWERDAGRVLIGNKLFGLSPGFHIARADLTAQADVERIELRAPLGGYDLVLYLGVHHHMSQEHGLHAIRRMLALSAGRFALRTTPEVEARDQLCELVGSLGFECEQTVVPEPSSFAGPLRLFRRVSA